MSETRVCTLQIACDGQPQPIENFPLRNRFTTRRQSYCYECAKKMGKNWYENNKDYQKANAAKHRVEYRANLRQYVLDYLATHPCVSCGETDPVVLEFHHARGKKENDVSVLIGRGSSLEKLKEEIEKCDVYCSNCHARLTAKERGFFRWGK
jgi:hypothetical protein